MNNIIKEDVAFHLYFKVCRKAKIQPFNFNEWRAIGRPKGPSEKDGYYGEIKNEPTHST